MAEMKEKKVSGGTDSPAWVAALPAAQSAEQAFVLTREKYDNGKANVTEYNDSRARYLEAQSNYLQARYEAVYQEKLLDFYRGQPLAF